jgi:uncharacterized membrane protein
MKNSDIIQKELEQLNKLHEIVASSIKEESNLVENIFKPKIESLNFGQKVSDKVASFGGSWRFIIYFGIVLFVWICFNSLIILKLRFDPYPFILMNLILSCIAALQAPIIMMSQNRQAEKDRIQSQNDYAINLKSELQIRSLHQKVDLLLEEQIQTLFEIQAKQTELLEKIMNKVENN